MTPELAVRNLIEEMVAAWNDGQWDRFSEVFANDGIYVTSAGVRLSGRQHIATYLSSLAAGKPPDKIVLNVDSLQLVAPLIALVLCSWQQQTTQNRRAAETSVPRAGVITMVMRGAADRFQLLALHNTHCRA